MIAYLLGSFRMLALSEKTMDWLQIHFLATVIYSRDKMMELFIMHPQFN